MKKNQEHINLEADLPKAKRPFKVPDQYFDQLEETILNRTIGAAPKVIKPSFIHSMFFKYAAAAVVVLSILISVLVLNQRNESPNSPQLVNQDDKEQIKSNDLEQNQPSTPIETPAIDKNSLANNQEEILIQKKAKEGTQVEQNPGSEIILKPSSKLKLREEQSPEIEIANNDAFNYQNLPEINNPLTPAPQQVTSNSGTTQQSGIAVARSGRKEPSIFYLPKDTCSTHEIMLRVKSKKSSSKRYNYVWSNRETGPEIQVQTSGLYVVYIYDQAERAAVDTLKTLVHIIPLPQPDLGPDQTLCSHESLNLDAGTYHKDYHYRWSHGNSTSAKLLLKPMSPGVHQISLAVEACGEVVEDNIMIHVNDCQLQFSNVITPNGDGQNDNFVIEGLENYPGSQLIIMDRNGRVVFESLNYQNNWAAKQLPAGTYFYLLRINDGKNSERGGSVTVLR